LGLDIPAWAEADKSQTISVPKRPLYIVKFLSFPSSSPSLPSV
jgi:hypothetical protein